MKVNFVYLLLVLFSLIISSSEQISAQSTNVDAVITKFIARRAKIEKAVESKDGQKVVQADLNGDGKKDAVILYSLESFNGNNNYRQYLAVFINRNNKLRQTANIVVGGKNYRGINSIKVSKARINLETLEYTEKDSSCCPSKLAKVYLTFKNNKLSKVKMR